MSSTITMNPKLIVFRALGGFTENAKTETRFYKGKVLEDTDKVLEELRLFMHMNDLILDVEVVSRKLVFIKNEEVPL
jgi:hypothetical protein